ncbi:MAG: trypsin-like peptidase domain-containing protein [Lachnospiraceae bacterium]|nr:trypsin-like peptidase domain-containing protein [Lachnospiraceae bacterium]
MDLFFAGKKEKAMSDNFEIKYNPETGEWITPAKDEAAEKASEAAAAVATEVEKAAEAQKPSEVLAAAEAQKPSEAVAAEVTSATEEAAVKSDAEVKQIIQQAEATTSPYFDHMNAQEEAPAQEKKGRVKAAKQKKQKAPKEPKQKKRMGFFGKAVAAVFLAAIFGGVAGGTFYGVCRYTGVFDQKPVVIDASESKTSTTSGGNPSGLSEVKPEDLGLPSDLTIWYGDGTEARLVNSGSVQVISSDISEMVEQVIPAMVTIVNTGRETYDFWYGAYTPQSSGTGVIIGENETELLIVTNNHVAKDAVKLEITFVDDSTATAVVKGKDADMDLAVLAVPLESLSEETRNAIVVAQLGDSDSLKLGQPAVVIGNALGIGISVTDGIISGLNREMTTEDGKTGTFIQTDAAVNHGNSGGALLNIKGEVIGIVSNKIDGESVEAMGYAIPISAASPIIEDLMNRVTRKDVVAAEEQGYLGVQLQTITDEARSYYGMPEGAYVYNVFEGSGAYEAGIRKGDVITKLEGTTIYSNSTAREILQYYRQGEEVTVKYSRMENGEYVSHEVTVVLGGAQQTK